MKRREFVKKSFQAGLITGAAFSVPGFYGKYFAGSGNIIPASSLNIDSSQVYQK